MYAIGAYDPYSLTSDNFSTRANDDFGWKIAETSSEAIWKYSNYVATQAVPQLANNVVMKARAGTFSTMLEIPEIAGGARDEGLYGAARETFGAALKYTKGWRLRC